MNSLTYEEITVGMTETFQAQITEQMMDAFESLSGDHSPLHCDADYAKRYGYVDRLAYGMLTASFLSTVSGMYLPGNTSITQEVEVKFLKPVYIGDELTIQSEVAEKQDAFRRITVKTVITNQQGEKVARAKLQIGVRDRPETCVNLQTVTE